MTTAAHLDPSVRHDALIVFDTINSNPNGDPDNDGSPRADDETGHGLVTDVAMKRCIRDTIATMFEGTGYGIFVEAGVSLESRIKSAFEVAKDSDAIAALCAAHWDVRMFGAVLTRGRGAGSVAVRGPVQLTFARSVDPILPISHTITRVTQTRQADIDKGERTEIGSKWSVPYGLYVARLHYSPGLAVKTGVTGTDLEALWEAIIGMWATARSSKRAGVDMCALHIFSHPTALGVAPARVLLNSIRYRAQVEAPRSADDYRQELPETLPAGVTLTSPLDIWSA